MANKPVTIIAKSGHQPAYGFLVALGEQVIVHAFEGLAEVSVTHDSDLIILDCGTDGDTGLMLIPTLKRRAPRVPIIFITGALSGNIAIQAYKAGARECFLQPVDLSDLRLTVEKILYLKRNAFRQRHSLSMMEPDDNLQPPQRADALPERLVRATQFIEQNLSKLISLTDVAREACLSKFHFCRVFKHYIGMTPLQYVASLRIEKAKQLLQQSEADITLVAMRVGINDPSNFIKLFKKFTGTTPSSYRKSSSKTPERLPV